MFFMPPLNSVLVSFPSTKNVGSMKPVAPPIYWQMMKKAMAPVLSFSPNHSTAIWAGAFQMNGSPQPAMTAPKMQ